MVRTSLPVRRFTLRGMASAFAFVASLTGVAVVGTGLTATAAAAQGKQGQNSRGFGTAYQPVADIANAEDGDIAAAKAQLPTVIAAIENDTDRFAAGNLVLIVGTKSSDSALQRQGLELMLESGQTPPEQVGQFHFFVGNLALAANDFAPARAALEAAQAAGYTEDNIEGLIAETYFQENNAAQGLAYLKGAIDQRIAAGQPIDNQWLLRGLKMAYESNDAAAATEWSTLLVTASPSEENWLNAIQVVGAVNNFDTQTELDLLRLMLATNTLKERRDFVSYIEAADPRIMANEVARVLAAGTQAGIFTESDEYYVDVKRVVDQRAPEDQAESAALAQEASSSTSGNAAQSAGDVFYSLADYAQAEAMYKMAVEKGADRERNLTRLGIAQAQQGKNADARATFEQVSGPRAPVAQLWTAYVSSKA